jgi:predicted AlkP superfamily pyrophosphatase or phosphodiesterase
MMKTVALSVAAWTTMIVWPLTSALAESEVPVPATVILISMDGTRPSDLTPEQLPSLVELGRKGLRAEALIPVDPANTFPSHVSMVTGVRPEEHRLVNNVFIDPSRGRFKRDAIHSWIESEPIWSVAERHGIPTASFHWVGSEGPWKDGPGPSMSKKFSSRTREKTKVTQILKWLAIEDPTRRPRLITSWFHGADHAGHVSGPGSSAVTESLAPQDAQIARLVREMEKRGLFESTTLIFVSDHGMALAEERVNLGRALRSAGLKVTLLGTGGFAIGVFKDGERTEAAMKRALGVAREAGLEAWSRQEAPESWHVSDVRFGDFLVRAPIGTAIVRSMTLIDGFHGYWASEPEMAGILVARGRGVSGGTRSGRVSSLAIAPTILELLGLPIPSQMKESPIPGISPVNILKKVAH